MRLRGFYCLRSLFSCGIFNGHIQTQLFQCPERLFRIGNSLACRFGLIGSDGHCHAGYIGDQLFDEPLAVLIGADKIPEGLSAVNQHTGTVEIGF